MGTFAKRGTRGGYCEDSFSEYENSILGYHRDPAYSRGLLMDLAAIKKNAVAEIEKKDQFDLVLESGEREEDYRRLKEYYLQCSEFNQSEK